ncbi:MAG: hypothetical protein M1825_002077 [Sarcosagium campestre]|nr:MAG: hypothetical protein M1825_002077 [Sarcosagium campestre]
MAPLGDAASILTAVKRALDEKLIPNPHGRNATNLDGNILEAWSQGFLVGGIMVLIMMTVANMRQHVLLHKLILIELIMALGHGTFIFSADPVYGCGTAIFLYLSWWLHNVVAWIKNKPFLSRWGSWLYIGTVIFVFPYWVAEMYLNFNYFNDLPGRNYYFQRTRPWEALARDPWWIFTTCDLVYIIKRQYNVGLIELIRASPRFGVLLLSMLLSIIFLLTDVIVSAGHLSQNDGINPFWKLALVFKCAADALFLDDFKKVLDVLICHTFDRDGRSHPETKDPNNTAAVNTTLFREFTINTSLSSRPRRASSRAHSRRRRHSSRLSSQARHNSQLPLNSSSRNRLHSSAKPASNESLDSAADQSSQPQSEGPRHASQARRPVVEWFDAFDIGGGDAMSGRNVISPAYRRPSSAISPTDFTDPFFNGAARRGSIDFLTTAL